ncbi:MAG: ABC transporter substrate-binding protein [Proteobacteria bacterium]|nr:ABC transporter substrate-binding protein [Pseudomonadota bacterium]MBU1594113.1 ABC transporter substrate-binding protein [Pseudomonadota bacterium]
MSAPRGLAAVTLALALLTAGPALGADAHATLTLVRGGDSVTLDPARASDSESALVTGQICEGLVRVKDGCLQVEPALAESWTVSPDGLAWTFRIRKNVRFHDGSPMNAQAAAIAIMRQVDPANPYHAPGMYTAKALFEHVAGAEALDETTLRIRLNRPSASLLFSLAASQAPILSPQALERWGADIGSHPVGTGPFQFLEWRRGESVTLVRNPHYWGGAPRLERLVFRTIPDAGARFLEFQTRRADAMTGIPHSDLPLLEKMPGVQILRVAGLNIAYLGINTQRGHFRRTNVRRAVLLALDREALARLVYGQSAVPAAALLPPALMDTGFVADEVNAKGDLAQARRLLAREGLSGGFGATLQVMDIPRPYLAEPRRMAQAIRQALAGLGIRVRIVTVPWADYVARAGQNEHDLILSGWTFDTPNPHELLRYKLGWDSSGNFSRWRDERFQALVNQAEASRDEGERNTLFRQILRLVAAEAPAVPLAHVRDTLAVQDSIKGVTLQPTGGTIRFAKAYREP